MADSYKKIHNRDEFIKALNNTQQSGEMNMSAYSGKAEVIEFVDGLIEEISRLKEKNHGNY